MPVFQPSQDRQIRLVRFLRVSQRALKWIGTSWPQCPFHSLPSSQKDTVLSPPLRLNFLTLTTHLEIRKNSYVLSLHAHLWHLTRQWKCSAVCYKQKPSSHRMLGGKMKVIASWLLFPKIRPYNSDLCPHMVKSHPLQERIWNLSHCLPVGFTTAQHTQKKNKLQNKRVPSLIF